MTVRHVSRESLGALSFRTAVVLRVKISNIRFKKERKALHNCGHSCCLRLCGRGEVDSAKRGVGNYRVITFDILLTIPLSVPAFKGTNSKMFRSLARGVRHNNNISCQPWRRCGESGSLDELSNHGRLQKAKLEKESRHGGRKEEHWKKRSCLSV